MSDRKAYFKKYRSKPGYKEKMKKHQQNWRDRHPKDSVAMSRRNREKHRKAFNKQASEKRKRERDELSPVYIRCLLKEQMKMVVKYIPNELIEIHRLVLLTNRKLKTAI